MQIPFLKKIKIPIFQIVLGGVIIGCLILIIPQIMALAKVSGELNEKKRILIEIDGGIKNFSGLEKELASLEKVYNDFLGKIPLQREFPVFLEIISKKAKKSNVKIIAIEPQKAIDDPALFFIKIPIYIDANCSYHELGRFINELEFGGKFIKIDNIKINADDADPLKQQVFLSVHAFCKK